MNFLVIKLGEVIQVTTNQYGLSVLSGLVSLMALLIYSVLNISADNDDDDSDSGNGGLMQPVT